MSITKNHFGFMPDGEEVYSYILDNGKNLKVEVINYGGIIKNIWVKNADGEYVDVVLGFDTLEEYFNNGSYFGAFVGRCANRIERGKFTIGDKVYTLDINNGKNTLHGGKKGFDKYVLTESALTDGQNPSVQFAMCSPDGDGGYPGNLNVKLTYTLTENNAIVIHYEAVSDKDTVINLTNHSYFNLNGEGSGDILNHTLLANCKFYTPNSEEGMPYGEVLSVKNTPFDFTAAKKVGEDIDGDYPQIKMFGGYDHNFVIEGKGFRKAATLIGDKTKITMDVFTDKPAFQLYTANSAPKDRVCKKGHVYSKHNAVCIETQYFPNSTTHTHFPSPVLKAGEKYDFTTEYRFV